MNYKLYSNIIPVRGFSRSVLVDIQNSTLFFIPNSLYEILNKYIINSQLSLNGIKKKYDNKHSVVIDEYFTFLNENNLLFECTLDELNLFPELDLVWKNNSFITNAVIDSESLSLNSMRQIIKELDNLNCSSVQLRFFNFVSIKNLHSILDEISNTFINNVEIIIKYSSKNKNIINIIEKHSRITQIIVHSSPFDKTEELVKGLGSKEVLYTKNEISEISCGVIVTDIINMKHFTESQCYNTCLNRKISVDANGYIKNCPSMKHHYGHISDTTLEEAIEKDGFKDLWFIRKDDIDVCKDCEFRHMCTDCRAFINDPENVYSQPAKCGYNPYIALWEGQDGWLSVEQWRAENPDWEKKALANRATYKTEDCSQYHK